MKPKVRRNTIIFIKSSKTNISFQCWCRVLSYCGLWSWNELIINKMQCLSFDFVDVNFVKFKSLDSKRFRMHQITTWKFSLMFSFIPQSCWMLDSDWLTNVLRCAIIFQKAHRNAVVPRLSTALVCITLQNNFFSKILTVGLGDMAQKKNPRFFHKKSDLRFKSIFFPPYLKINLQMTRNCSKQVCFVWFLIFPFGVWSGFPPWGLKCNQKQQAKKIRWQALPL